MKKNININLFGTIYAIDEDAYQLMDSYLKNIKDYFSKREGGEEVADDIEHRFAELLWEKKNLGVEAIDIITIKEIIRKIGKPEELDSNSGQADQNNDRAEAESGNGAETKESVSNEPNSANASPVGSRKLYRDGRDKLVAGLMSGICHYFNANDPFPWRIALVLLFLLLPHSGWLAVLYLIAWMLVPEAKTAEDRLRMMGKAVNADNIGDEVMRENNPQPKQESAARGCLGTLLDIAAVLFKAMLYIVVGVCGFAIVVSLFAFCIGMFFVPFGILSEAFNGASDNALLAVQMISYVQSHQSMILVMGILMLVVVILPVYALIRLLGRHDNKLSTSTKVLLIVLWLASLFGSAVCSTKFAQGMRENGFDLSNLGTVINSHTNHSYSGEGKVVEISEPFDQLDLSCNARVVYSQADSCSVCIKGDDNMIDKIGVVSQGGVLQVWMQEKVSKDSNHAVVYVTSPNLTSVKMSDLGAFETEGRIVTPGSLSLVQEGIGAMEVQAKCTTLSYKGKGVGAAELDVDVDSLIVSHDGIGAVELKGQARFFENHKSGIGAIDADDLKVGE